MTIETHRHSDTDSPESGQTMAEYSLVLGLIVLVTVATFTLLSGGIEQAFDRTVALVDLAG